MKNKRNIHNFGATSELASQILTRVKSKLNPSPNKGVVSSQSRQLIGNFSTWEVSKGVSDELKKFMGPLEVGHQSTCPDASGLELTRINNGIFDEAMKNVIMEMYQESNQMNFAEGDNNEALLKKIFIKDGKVNPISTGLVSAGAAALYTSLTKKKKKKEEEKREDDMLDLAKSAAIGYLAGHGGAVVYNGAGESTESNKPKIGKEKTKEESQVEDVASKDSSNKVKKEDKIESKEVKSSTAATPKFTPYHLADKDEDLKTLKVSYGMLDTFNKQKKELVLEKLRELNPGMSENDLIANASKYGIRVPVEVLPEHRAFRSFDPNDRSLYVRSLINKSLYRIDENTLKTLYDLAKDEDNVRGKLNKYDQSPSNITEYEERLMKYLAHQHAVQNDLSVFEPDTEIYLDGKKEYWGLSTKRTLLPKEKIEELTHRIKKYSNKNNNK